MILHIFEQQVHCNNNVSQTRMKLLLNCFTSPWWFMLWFPVYSRTWNTPLNILMILHNFAEQFMTLCILLEWQHLELWTAIHVRSTLYAPYRNSLLEYFYDTIRMHLHRIGKPPMIMAVHTLIHPRRFWLKIMSVPQLLITTWTTSLIFHNKVEKIVMINNFRNAAQAFIVQYLLPLDGRMHCFMSELLECNVCSITLTLFWNSMTHHSNEVQNRWICQKQ